MEIMICIAATVILCGIAVFSYIAGFCHGCWATDKKNSEEWVREYDRRHSK